MTTTTRWLNDEQTMLLVSYRGIIAEQDFVEIMDRVHQLIAGRAQPVHIIHDYGSSNVNELLNGENQSSTGGGAIAS